MIVLCRKCGYYYEDVFRRTFCPHETFLANDGHGNREYHPEAYLSRVAPPKGRIFEAHR